MPVYGALDLAAQTGVCFGEAFGQPSFETWNFEGSLGRRGVMLRNAMLKLIQRIEPAKIFIEKPLVPAFAAKIGVSFEANIALNGYVMIAHAVCYAAGIDVDMHDRQDVLGHFVGRRSFRQETVVDPVSRKKKIIKDGAKRACDARCRQLRWNPSNYDEADAAALWDYGCASLHRKHFISKISGDRPMMFGRRAAA